MKACFRFCGVVSDMDVNRFLMIVNKTLALQSNESNISMKSLSGEFDYFTFR
jgi:hypothetical protein